MLIRPYSPCAPAAASPFGANRATTAQTRADSYVTSDHPYSVLRNWGLAVCFSAIALGAASPLQAQSGESSEGPRTEFEFSPLNVELQPIEAGIKHPRVEVTVAGAEVSRTQFFGPMRSETGLNGGLILRGTAGVSNNGKFQAHEGNLIGPRLEAAQKFSLPLDAAARNEDDGLRSGHEVEEPTCASPLACILHGSTRAVASTELGVEVPLSHPGLKPYSHSSLGIERGGQWKIHDHKYGVTLALGAEFLKTPGEPTSVGPQLEWAIHW